MIVNIHVLNENGSILIHKIRSITRNKITIKEALLDKRRHFPAHQTLAYAHRLSIKKIIFLLLGRSHTLDPIESFVIIVATEQLAQRLHRLIFTPDP